MVAKRIIRQGSQNQTRVVREGDYVGEYIFSDYDKNKCHDNVVLEGGVAGIKRNSVLIKEDGSFRCINFAAVLPGVTDRRGCITRGPIEVSDEKLNWPVVTNAVDGSDAGTDNAAENALATAALKADLIEEMAALFILVR